MQSHGGAFWKPLVLAASMWMASCATATRTGPIDQREPRRVVGTENEVRFDAEIVGEQLAASMSLPLKYDITNNRQTAIAVADLIPEVGYDDETGTVTIGIGSEVPGATLLPRLIAIKPGEKKSFSSVARVNILLASGTPITRIPRQLRLKLNFLDDVAQFEQLIAMTEKGLYDPKLADELFPKWLERNETVFTNTLPMRWTMPATEENPLPSRKGRRRG